MDLARSLEIHENASNNRANKINEKYKHRFHRWRYRNERNWKSPARRTLGYNEHAFSENSKDLSV